MYDSVYRRELNETVARESAHLRVGDCDRSDKTKPLGKTAAKRASTKLAPKKGPLAWD
jgi:hypothetical protein